jgi:hypothetical protein
MEETLHDRGAGLVSREGLINLDFSAKLFSLEVSGLWHLGHNARMDLVDEGDASSPDPVHTRKLALDVHDENRYVLKSRTDAEVPVLSVFRERECEERGREGKEGPVLWMPACSGHQGLLQARGIF